MKATKLSPNPEILFKIFYTACLCLALVACDTLNEDPDVITPDAKLTGDEIVVAGNSTSIIDLRSRIQTNVPVTLTVTSQTTKGRLTALGNGLLQYAPAKASQKTTDTFEFTVITDGNQVVRRDTAVIIVEPDTTQLPCGVYAIDDHVYNLRADSVVTIDVLANDVTCGVDSADLAVSIVQIDSLGPRHGTATVVNNRIVYTAGSSFSGADKFIYKIQSKRDAAVVSYAVVTIGAKVSTCVFALFNDSIAFDVDTLQTDTVSIPVFDNDRLCGLSPGKYTTTIVKAPNHGTAAVSKWTLTITPPPMASGTLYGDSLRYRVCRNDTCREATVWIRMMRLH